MTRVVAGSPLPAHVAVLGAAGGLGRGILRICRLEGIGFTAIVRSRPERITDVPRNSRVSVIKSLADEAALATAFSGADAVLAALGVTAMSCDSPALLSRNTVAVEAAMLAAGVDRLIAINSLLTGYPGTPPSRAMRFFSMIPGMIGRGASELQAVADAFGNGAFSRVRWTLVRAGVNSRGKHERPVAARDWDGAPNSLMPVSYESMGRWMLEEAAANSFVRAAPLVSRSRR